MRRFLLFAPLFCLPFAGPAFAGAPPKAAPAAPASASASAAAPAAEPVKTDAAVAAQELFDQGIKLLEAGKFAEACPKFEASNKAAWAPGTTINLADCYERVGRLASAWAKFLEAEPHFRNRTPPDPRADIAKQRAEALYPKLSRITIEMPIDSHAPGIVVKRDGDVIDDSQWGTGLPVDPGKHVVEVTAPGKEPWTWEADVGSGGATVTVKVPVLKDAAAAPSASSTATAAPDTGMPVQKKIALGAGAAGIVGLALGGVFGGLTMGKVADSNKTCAKQADGTFRCDAAGAALRDDAKGMSMISTIGFVAGGVLAAGGVVLWLTSPSSAAAGDSASPPPKSASLPRRTGLWIAPVVGPTTGFSAGGRF
jgi:hypothetical protein